MPDTTVKYYSSDMDGAPGCAQDAGDLIAVLDACLVNGFDGGVAVSTLVIASNVATVTFSSAHDFDLVGNTGMVIEVSGATTPAEINAEWRIADVPSSTTLTFATTGISDQSATGTPAITRAPLGFTKEYSDTNKAAYLSGAADTTGHYLRVDDTNLNYGVLRVYESMTDIDTGNNATPQSVDLYVGKSTTATDRDWVLFGDDKLFVFSALANGVQYNATFVFGDIISEVPADAYHNLLIAINTSPATSSAFPFYVGTRSDRYLSRPYTQLGSSFNNVHMYAHGNITLHIGLNSGLYGHVDVPSVSTGKVHFAPIDIWDDANTLRGRLPGIFAPLHAVTDTDIWDQTCPHSGGEYKLQRFSSSNEVVGIEIGAAWR